MEGEIEIRSDLPVDTCIARLSAHVGSDDGGPWLTTDKPFLGHVRRDSVRLGVRRLRRGAFHIAFAGRFEQELRGCVLVGYMGEGPEMRAILFVWFALLVAMTVCVSSLVLFSLFGPGPCDAKALLVLMGLVLVGSCAYAIAGAERRLAGDEREAILRVLLDATEGRLV